MRKTSNQFPIVLLDRLPTEVTKLAYLKGSVPVHIALNNCNLNKNREEPDSRSQREQRSFRRSQLQRTSSISDRLHAIRRQSEAKRQKSLRDQRSCRRNRLRRTSSISDRLHAIRRQREVKRQKSDSKQSSSRPSQIRRQSSISKRLHAICRQSGVKTQKPMSGQTPSPNIYQLRRRTSSLHSKVRETNRLRAKREEREKSRLSSGTDIESPSISTRSNRRRDRTNSVNQSINDAGSSVSTSSNGCSFVSTRTLRSDKEPPEEVDQRRQPLAPLRCCFSTDDESPATPEPKASSLRTRSHSPSPHTSPMSIIPTPRKRQHRFRLLRAKNVEWDETINAEKFENQHHTRFRAAGGKWRQKNARELVLQKAKQTEPVPWSDFLTGMTKENFVFLGEGDFSEVYCYSTGKISIAIKVMPAVDDNDKEAPDEIKGYSHYIPEIMASKLVTKLAYKFHENRTHGFAKLMGMYIVQGRLPQMLRDVRASAAGIFEEDIFNDLPASQEWLVLKYPFVGKPLDSMSLEVSPQAMRSIVAQIAITMAAAERVYEFEHRDLHFGNLLIQNVRFDRLRYRVDGENFSVPSEGLMVTIIDFTLARVKDEDGEVYFVDLANDEEDEEQDPDEVPDHLKVHYETKEMNRNRWNVYNPSSNIIWLKYLCTKFLHLLNTLPMGERMRKRKDNTHNAIHSEIQVLVESMSCFESCSELVRTNFFFDSFRKSKDEFFC